MSTGQTIAILLVNVGSFIFAYILLRWIWPPPTQEQLAQDKALAKSINDIKTKHYHSLDIEDEEEEAINSSATSSAAPAHHLHNNGLQSNLNVNASPNSGGSEPSSGGKKSRKRAKEAIECLEGESAGDYSLPWMQTFDLTFLIIMSLALAALAVWTTLESPGLWLNGMFWLEQVPKLATMMLVSYIGGLMCRYFCEHDEIGYIVTNKQSVFKVNYTRKLQHFAAYLVPLLMHSRSAGASVSPALTLAWGNWVTLLGFLILIKPIRERSEFVMLQFNALDRPEDRPSTLSWIVGGNIIPGCVLIVFFRWLYSMTDQSDLAYIFIFITGLGDGLAEPVGIYLGQLLKRIILIDWWRLSSCQFSMHLIDI